MRISDWSSDVCSSDLAQIIGRAQGTGRTAVAERPPGRAPRPEPNPRSGLRAAAQRDHTASSFTFVEVEMAEQVLVTGGLGFIGRHLCAELREAGYRVRVLDAVIEQVHGGSVPSLPEIGRAHV